MRLVEERPFATLWLGAGASRARFTSHSRNKQMRKMIFGCIAMIDEAGRLSWPWGALFALLAVALVSVLTVGAAHCEIL